MKNRSTNSKTISPGMSALGALLYRFIRPLGRRALLDGGLEHLGTVPLTAQSSLALVRLHDETLLLGITAHSVTVLTKTRETKAADAREPRPVTLTSDGKTAVSSDMFRFAEHETT